MFEDKTLEFIEKLKYQEIFDEWYLSNFIDENVKKLSSEDAFQLSSLLITQIRSNLESDLLYELLQIFLSLKAVSQTNQHPKQLIEDPEIFEDILKLHTDDSIISITKDLKKMYNL